MKQPLCRCCGKPIAKRTNWKTLTTDLESMKYGPERKMLVDRLPQTKVEAQWLFNERVVAVKRARKYNYETDTYTDLGIDTVTLWDGHTYVDHLFCTMQCAARFGRIVANTTDFHTVAYANAKAKEVE